MFFISIIVLFAFLVILLFIGFIFDESKFGEIFLRELPFISILLLNAFSTMLNYRQWQYWKRIEQRRIATVRGDLSLLAVEQPAASAAGLPLPFTLTIRYGKVTCLKLVGMSMIFFAAYLGLVAWTLKDAMVSLVSGISVPVVVCAVVFFLCLIGLLLIFLLRRQRQIVDVTEQAISMSTGSKQSLVRWEEARLFAVYHTWGAQRNQSSLTYELSSMTDIVRWTEVVRRPGFFQMGMTPTIPLGEHVQQIQALNALVVARTGLPLYDLRKESTLDDVHPHSAEPLKSEL
ncbi:hypothetical protein [Dictyobacter kobayashii]|uniref:Uncharacterized protein n=1 Tax=Dictyobacter kobayashii TaxID=2014872 RepID=A0A402AYG5_9CHLR|nr:hypothetical protein [Dictyobacter kobayashii]GCE24114.1 hypothetical protein KDK_79140 [Dictyobacter kobayashii]